MFLNCTITWHHICFICFTQFPKGNFSYMSIKVKKVIKLYFLLLLLLMSIQLVLRYTVNFVYINFRLITKIVEVKFVVKLYSNKDRILWSVTRDIYIFIFLPCLDFILPLHSPLFYFYCLSYVSSDLYKTLTLG